MPIVTQPYCHRRDAKARLCKSKLTHYHFVYLVDYCGAFQAGKFELGQAVDYRVDETDQEDLRIYIRRDGGKEYKCKIEGKKVLEDAKSAALPAKP